MATLTLPKSKTAILIMDCQNRRTLPHSVTIAIRAAR